MLLQSVNLILGSLTLIGQIFLFIYLVYLLFFARHKNNYISSLGIKFSFIVALIATLGSLFYSQIISFTPCDLCWFQRIFMYPQVILLGLAMIKKDNKIIDYSLALAIIGALISLYHNYISYTASSLLICGVNRVSCTIRYVFEFDYITLPLMSLTAFLIIIILLISQKKKD